MKILHGEDAIPSRLIGDIDDLICLSWLKVCLSCLSWLCNGTYAQTLHKSKVLCNTL